MDGDAQVLRMHEQWLAMTEKRSTAQGSESTDSELAETEEQSRMRKQQETINRVLAGSIVTQLLNFGCDEGQVIDFATEVLHNVTALGWNRNNGSIKIDKSSDAPSGNDRDVVWRMTTSDDGAQTIRGRRVVLSSLAPENVVQLKTWREQPHIKQTCSHKLLSDLIESHDRGAREERHDFVVRDPSNRPIGLVTLFHVDRQVRQAEIAKLVGEPSALGLGFAHEATSLLLCYAFQILGLQRVYLRTNGFNVHNIKLNEKLGFRFEGILRASEILNDELIDVVLMSMIGREFVQMYRVREFDRTSQDSSTDQIS